MDIFEEYAPRAKEAYVEGTLSDAELEAALDTLAHEDLGPKEARERLQEFGLSRLDTLPPELLEPATMPIA